MMEVKVNLDKLLSTKIVYDHEIAELQMLCNRIDKNITSLRENKWKTPGADAFFQTYNDEWKCNLQKHISYLEHLRDCLSRAYESFHEAYNKKILEV